MSIYDELYAKLFTNRPAFSVVDDELVFTREKAKAFYLGQAEQIRLQRDADYGEMAGLFKRRPEVFGVPVFYVCEDSHIGVSYDDVG